RRTPPRRYPAAPQGRAGGRAARRAGRRGEGRQADAGAGQRDPAAVPAIGRASAPARAQRWLSRFPRTARRRVPRGGRALPRTFGPAATRPAPQRQVAGAGRLL
ncbi:MAG: hypothetical protein E6G05_14440, partial [Actinobacteria bacterium]